MHAHAWYACMRTGKPYLGTRTCNAAVGEVGGVKVSPVTRVHDDVPALYLHECTMNASHQDVHMPRVRVKVRARVRNVFEPPAHPSLSETDTKGPVADVWV